jgi:hypothetical protein
MKVYINREPKTGPWGGGIKTVNKLVETLRSRGHEVVFRLEDGIDVVFCIDPRPNSAGEWYRTFLYYKSYNENTKIIQRVGDLGTHSKPELTSLVKQTMEFSDYIIFPSEWAQEWIDYRKDNCTVVHNAPMSIFHQNKKKKKRTTSKKPKIVTHHWSMNPKKGFHVYEQLEKHIAETGEFDFTYIGRLPDNVKLSKHIEPIGAEELSVELPKHEIYITASIQEAGANHVLEAMAAGLPVVYHEEGGSINNYCHKYGKEFSSFEELLNNIREVSSNYGDFKKRVLKYDINNSHVVDKYIEIIEEVGNA